jgi:hypothetical protein
LAQGHVKRRVAESLATFFIDEKNATFQAPTP